MIAHFLPRFPTFRRVTLRPRLDRQALGEMAIFYLVIPSAFGLVLGVNQSGIALHLTWGMAIAYWIGLTMTMWIGLHICTQVTALALRPWRPPLLLVLSVGALLASVPMRRIIYAYTDLYSPFLLHGRTVQTFKPFSLEPEFLSQHFRLWAGVFVVWTFTNVVLDRYMRMPRYRFGLVRLPEEPAENAVAPEQSEHVAVAVATTAPLFERLPRELGTDIIALKAEDHYVRVFTARGEALVLARLVDAIRELGPTEGSRVHRSYWISRAAVVRIEASGRNLVAHLRNGLEVPVSQTYKEVARQAGLWPA
jgi:hypothetical protein